MPCGIGKNAYDFVKEELKILERLEHPNIIWLHEIIEPMKADIKGYWPTTGYDFTESRALSPCRTYFYGLAVDDDQQFEQTDARIATWVQQILAEFELEEAA